MTPLRMALIGGGGAGFIGKVHATAATLDRQAELVAGALSSDPQRSRDSAAAFGISPQRAYGSYRELLEAERNLPAAERVQFVSIATPNHTHCEIALAALEAGFHVVCDKPMTTTVEDAQRLADAVAAGDRVFALTHNYSGYPLVRQARQMIAAGLLGELIAVRVSYMQGWMHGMDPDQTPARGAWKSDPALNGAAGSLGDVGTHAYQLLRFVTGARPSELMCEMKSYSPHHELDDYGHAVLRLGGGATGLVTFSQVTHGRLNDLTLEVDGTKASLLWRQEVPNQLEVRSLGEATKVYERNPGAEYMAPLARESCRLPGGHGEAFFEAFANVYRDAFADMRRIESGQPPSDDPIYPTVADGLEGVQFIHHCLASQQAHSTWRSW